LRGNMPCFYFPELKKGDESLQITGTEHHHIVHVRRLNEGDEIVLTSGNGLLAKAVIDKITKKTVEAKILSFTEIEQSLPRIAVAFSLLKSKNDHIIIEKLTELGTKEFFPLFTRRSVRKISPNSTKKFYSTAIAAIKQCDNAHLPRIHEPMEIIKALNFIKEKGFTSVIALEQGNRISINEALKMIKGKDVCIIIGPEGGFSDEEIEYFKQNDLIRISLGNHILRA
jgi:16S rRNA (uracil1498-N3)-methyltransferase